MNGTCLRRLLRAPWLAAPLLLLCLPLCAAALTPESPEVKEAVRKAIAFLESDAANDDRLGAKALVGLALIKHGAGEEHPKVAAAVQAIQGRVRNREPAATTIDIYSTGLSIIFLVNLDPSKYQGEIQWLLDSLKLRQKPHGGWGYPDRDTGDTSMTQYGALSYWEATQAAFAVPQESLEAVTLWLLRTQDPSGGFGYQGAVSESFTPIKQKEVKHSLTAAGLGSVYLCADLLGFGAGVEKRDENLPPALREVKAQPDKAPEAEKPKTKVDVRVLRDVQNRGNRWMRANFDIDPGGWTHYYLYALERYHSIREASEDKIEREPRWYTAGAQLLIRTQKPDGSWESKAKPTADTAFGALFLLRSMKKSIERARQASEGRLIVGRGLPPQTEQLAVYRGEVRVKPLEKPLDELAAILRDPKHGEHQRAVLSLGQLAPAEAEALLSQHASLVQALLKDRSAAVRMAAIRLAATARSLDCVPPLIAALGDADEAIAAEARRALHRIGRRPAAAEPAATPAERKAEIERWKAWYRGIRPGAEFEG